MPVRVDADPALGVGIDHALLAIDGDGTGFVLTPKPAGAPPTVALTLALPARTTFTSFAVPNVLETPSPSQTFLADVTVEGSDAGRGGPFTRLGRVRLVRHAGRGELTTFAAEAATPVRWVRVTLSDGLAVERERTFFEFSEIAGYGRQEAVPLAMRFTGQWQGRGVLLQLAQSGPSVGGCYDRAGDLTGTVSGNVLRAVGRTGQGNIPSAFVLTVRDDGTIFGVRSTNGAPFRLYTGAPGQQVDGACREAAPRPGCGAIVHGVRFDHDSATLRPESAPLLDALHTGLAGDPATNVAIVGHTSSEGSAAYNDDLSLRRAQAAVAALVELGLDAGRLEAVGRGEREPLADNGTESGRSLNRRVELACRPPS